MSREIETRVVLTEKESKEFWRDKRVLVTGGRGFVGRHLVKRLGGFDPKEIFVPRQQEFDLREIEACAEVVKNKDIIIDLAANVGGIGYNRDFPGTLFYDNVLMGVHMLEEARKAGVKKFVGMGTICAYPKFAPVPFREEDLWTGYPEETNAAYGLAKKMLLVQGQAYRHQYGFNVIHLMPVNLYGPGDKFEPHQSHVIPALIRKTLEANERGDSHIVVWGTGRATREFLYVEDAAEGILLAAERYNKGEPVNLGSGFEISIKHLAELICELADFEGEIVWDTTKPDGQPRRRLDVSRAEREFGFRARTDFREGLSKTIDWYIRARKEGLFR